MLLIHSYLLKATPKKLGIFRYHLVFLKPQIAENTKWDFSRALASVDVGVLACCSFELKDRHK